MRDAGRRTQDRTQSAQGSSTQTLKGLQRPLATLPSSCTRVALKKIFDAFYLLLATDALLLTTY